MHNGLLDLTVHHWSCVTYLDVFRHHCVKCGHEVIVLGTLEVFESAGQHSNLVLLIISFTGRVKVKVIILILVCLALASLFTHNALVTSWWHSEHALNNCLYFKEPGTLYKHLAFNVDLTRISFNMI